MEFIQSLSDSKPNRNLQGGKGFNLVKLFRHNFNVPNGFIITTDAYKHFISNSKYKTELQALFSKQLTPKNVLFLSEKIQSYIMNSQIPNEIVLEIKRIHKRFRNKNSRDIRYSVRSSATIEDCETFSFAGQADTFLYKKTLEEILTSIKKCWGSLFSPRALLYMTQIKKNRQDIGLDNIHMAVLIQEMIDAQISGVLFTANVLNNNTDQMLINSTWGLGEALVSNKIIPDTIIVNKHDKKILKTIIGKKEKKTVPDYKNSTSKLIKTNHKSQKKCCLSEEQIEKLYGKGSKIEDLYHCPQDIEWAIKGNDVFILQTRPITTIKKI